MNYLRINEKGFTLIEVLIAVSLIAVLSAVMFAAINPDVLLTRSKRGRAEAELHQLVEVIDVARVSTGMVLGQLSGNWCSLCSCIDEGELDSLEPNHQCYQDWDSFRNNLRVNSGGVVDLTALERDPWGSPYLVEEAELGPGTDPCNHDQIRSAGPDRIYGTDDDIIIYLPFHSAECVSENN